MLTVLNLRNSQNESIRDRLRNCNALHITDRISELSPENFLGLHQIEHLVIGPQLEEIHAENSGFRPSGRKNAKGVLIPKNLFRELHSLRQLEIRMKEITELGKGSFAHLPNLECLILSGNRISKIQPQAFAGLEKLGSLYLDHNRLTQIDRHYFSCLRSLSVLYLNSNRIETLGPSLFGQTPDLFSLNLQKNLIKHIDPTTFKQLPHLSYLNLGENPIAATDFQFMQAIGETTQISIRTKKGNLKFSKSGFLGL